METNFKRWASVLTKGLKKALKDFKYPDIDFSDHNTIDFDENEQTDEDQLA